MSRGAGEEVGGSGHRGSGERRTKMFGRMVIISCGTTYAHPLSYNVILYSIYVGCVVYNLCNMYSCVNIREMSWLTFGTFRLHQPTQPIISLIMRVFIKRL